jgi:MFS family permease
MGFGYPPGMRISTPFARLSLMPPETSQDARVLLTARGLRAFGDGFVSILLPVHLVELGLSNFQIGAVATSTLLGSAALTLLVGVNAHRIGRRALLFRASVLMCVTGLGFALLRDFWPLLLIAFLGTINPSSGDVSVFLPTELALLPQTTSDAQRTALFARFSMIGSLVAAFGAAGRPRTFLVPEAFACDRTR